MIFFWTGVFTISILGCYYMIRMIRKPISHQADPLAHGLLEAVSVIGDENSHKDKIAQLTLLANTDYLTGLYNYHYFICRLDEMLADSMKTDRPFSLILFDFNDFTYNNLFFNRIEGDNLLKKVAGIIKQMTPLSGIAARYGGDEIVLLLPDYDINKSAKLVENITQGVEAAFFGKENISLAAGISCYPETALDKQNLINLAYQELFHEKELRLNKLSSYHLVLQSIKGEQADSLELMALAKLFLLTIHLKDHYTLSHTDSVVKYAQGLGQGLSLSQKEIDSLMLGALFHDVGKIQISQLTLMKNGVLTEREWHQIQQHPLWSKELLSVLISDESVLAIVKHHHERYDGMGYPDGLAGDQIPLGARILAVADSFSAMTAERPYRTALTVPQALKEVKKNAGTQYDPVIADTLVQIIDQLL